MSIQGMAKEATGFIKEEFNEHKPDAEHQAAAAEGRAERNEGRIEDGKAPMLTKPGTDLGKKDTVTE